MFGLTFDFKPIEIYSESCFGLILNLKDKTETNRIKRLIEKTNETQVQPTTLHDLKRPADDKELNMP